MELKEQILVALGLNKTLRLAWQSKSEDGTIFVSTADELTSGVDISVLTEDGTTIPVPSGTYTTGEGVTFRVENEGIVSEVIETETEEVVEEALAEGDKEKEEEDEYADVGDWEGMEKRIQNLEDAVASLKEDKVGGDTEMADEEATEEVAEEVVTEVVETVEAAVEEIAAAIDDATPAEVTPELAAKAAEVAIEIIQEKAEEVAEEVTLSRKRKLSKGKTSRRKLSKRKPAKRNKLSRLERELTSLKEKLRTSPADSPLAINRFSSSRPEVSKQDLQRMTKQEKFLHNLYK
jgi:hypothetical protein|tara:strand:- start:621 stop:1496 length:876 start_codon:yes stop_codon:yes gene_type:complete